MTRKLIRPSELAEILGVSTVTLWRWKRSGILPNTIQLGPRLVAWREETIDEWLKEKGLSIDDQTQRN